MSLLMNGAALAVAFMVAFSVGLRERAATLALGTVSGVLVMIHATVLAAGLTGHLTVGGLSTVLAIAVAAGLWIGRHLHTGQAASEERPRFTVATFFAPLAAVLSSVVWAWPHLFEATRLWIWDDYTYHMVYPALWLRERAIAAVSPAQAFTMQAWYPLSASVVATWFMAPFPGLRGDALAWVSFTGLLYAAMIVSGFAAVLARLGCRRGAWAVPIVLFATSERISVMAASFSDADLAQAAALLAALVFAIPRGDVETPHDVRVDTCYAALLSGFALGVKASAALAVTVIIGMSVLRTRASSGIRAGRWRAIALTTLVFCLGWAMTGAYWYARNVIHTGNPLYPAAFLLWPGARFPETTLLEYSRHYGVRRSLADAFSVYLNWPPLHAALAMAGLVGVMVWLAWHRRSATRSQAYGLGGMLMIAALMLAVLPIMPYSAGNAMTFRAGLIHWDSMRYIALLPLLGWVALGFLLDAGAGARPGRTLPAVLVTAGATLASKSGSTVALAGSVLGALVLGRLPWRCKCRAAWNGAAMAATLVAAGVVWSHGAKAAATSAAIYREPLFGRATAVLDTQPPGTRVAIFGDQWVYPTFGAANDLVPVRLDGDGRVTTVPVGAAFGPGDLTVDPRTLRANLGASRVDLVVVVHLPHPGRSPRWPTQQAALETITEARLLYRDGAVAIWRLVR